MDTNEHLHGPLKTEPPINILVVDDETEMGEFIAEVSEFMNVHCVVTTSVADFMKALTPTINLLMIDLIMPEMDGIELLRLLKEKKCESKIILMSGMDKRVLEIAENLAHTLGLPVVGRLQKPFRQADVEKVIKNNLTVMEIPPTPTAQAKEMDPNAQTFEISQHDLENALKREEFIVHYQPQINLKNNQLIGMEALVRWQHPSLGLIFPDVFIAKVETFGLIDALGWYVIKRSFSEFKQFADLQDELPTLSINVSSYSLNDLAFPDTLLTLAKESHIPIDKIIIEITESGLVKEISSALDILTRLRMKGVQLSIDDFGTGYSMLTQLQHIPATELKIDKAFVQNVLIQDSARIMVQKSIEIGHELGMKVLAEGVETQEQLDFLRKHHCDIVQGYFYSRPLPAHAFVQWMKARNG